MDRYIEFLGKFHRANVQHLGPHAGHLQHLIVRYALQLPRLIVDVGIGGVHSGHISVDLANISSKGSSHGNGRGV